MKAFHRQKKQLFRSICNLESEAQAQAFLGAVLTDRELEEVIRRLEIIRLLKGGVAQREIVKRLGVGIATVTRGSKVLKSGILERLGHEFE